ncbi:unnamed protein product [Trichogramma brassicae]|uniref:Uncharacterized protein n=1 Tax=Trichogramma brassicae TaxID=86971 RepID=A0A6H5IXC4_9HYME|nr:unnamed protein product [Trichogramma brassicae]
MDTDNPEYSEARAGEADRAAGTAGQRRRGRLPVERQRPRRMISMYTIYTNK